MADANDMELMRQYAEDNSESAFAELVQRHINLVHSVAFRFVGNSPDAQDVTQAVFVILIRKISGLRQRNTLTGWLYETTRLTSRQFLRTKSRQQAREQEAYMQSVLQQPDNEIVWKQVAPVLEEAMTRLNEKERMLLALRFFENKTLAETAALLGIEEWAARKRASRAVEKLQKFFFKRGINSTAEASTSSISANAIQPAPVALAKTVTAIAIAKGATASASTLTLIKGALKIMAWTKAKTVIVTGVAAIVAISTATTGTVVAIHKHRANVIENYFAHYDSVDLDTAPPVLILRPSKYSGQGDWVIGGLDTSSNGKVLRRGCSLAEILSTAFGVGREQMILPAGLPRGQFDLMLTVPDPEAALQAQIKKQFGLVAHSEMRDTDVAVLKMVSSTAPGLKITGGGAHTILINRESLKLTNYKMSGDPGGNDIVHALGSWFVHLPVIDETGLNDSYDVSLQFNGKQELKNALRTQLGLELVPTNMPIQMLVVEKAP